MILQNENGLRIGNLTMRLARGRNMKLYVFRNDRKELPHLTISWQNPSKQIDIHLTKRTPSGNKNHQPIAKISETVLKEACEHLVSEMLKIITANIDKVRKVRPGWLARNGYVVLYLPNDVQERLIQEFVPKQKRHGKWTHIVDKELITGRKQPQVVIDGLYHPTILYKLAELDYREPLFAVCGHRKFRKRLISLMLAIKPTGRPCWVRIDNLAKEMMKKVEELMIFSIKQMLPNNAWETIQGELYFDELGFKT
jgi:hypothetical protein